MRRMLRLAVRAFEVARTSGIRAMARLTYRKLEGALRTRAQRVWRFALSHGRSGRLERLRVAANGPRISVIVPVHNVPPEFLNACVRSVLQQKYPNWELCICDDHSTRPDTVSALEAFRGTDSRIRIVRSETGLHISRATNLAAEQATGKYLAFLDHDDCLDPLALHEIAKADLEHGDIDVMYSDEDKLDQDGGRCDTYYKPDWSPDHLDSVMYMLHLLVVRKALFWQLGGLRDEVTGAQDYDLALRACARARRIHHIEKILYHWRMIPGSAAAAVDAKPYALLAARRALEESIRDRGLDASVQDGMIPGTFRVRASARPPVTLLVLTNHGSREIDGRGRVFLLRNFLESIVKRSTYPSYRIVVVDNGNAPEEARRFLLGIGAQLESHHCTGPFNFSRKLNFAARFVRTEHVVFLNDDLEVLTPDWLESLVDFSAREDIGAVGARLLYADGRVQHAGIVLGVNGSAAHIFHGMPGDAVGYNGYTHVNRNYSAVTGAVLASRMSVFRAVGGFDEKLAIDFNDVDFCLRVREKGLRVAYTPYCQLLHFEGSTQQRRTQDPAEVRLFLDRWRDVVRRDPFYNVNLPRNRIDCQP